MAHSAPAVANLAGPDLRKLEDKITEPAAHIHAAMKQFKPKEAGSDAYALDRL